MSTILYLVPLLAAALTLIYHHRLSVWQASIERRLSLIFMRRAKAECVRVTKVTANALLRSVECGELEEGSAIKIIFLQCRMLGIRPSQVLALEEVAEA